jgi:hypothetical protein
MILDVDLYRRAGAICLTSHAYEGVNDWPCKSCVERASAIAPSAGGSGPTGGGALGVAGVPVLARRPPATPPCRRHRLGTWNPKPAEGATAIARTDGTP